jgi:ComF family protein
MPGILTRLTRLARLAGMAGTRCPVCSVLTDGQDTPLCPDCALALRPRRHGCCIRCGDMFGDSADHAPGDHQSQSPAPPIICAECRLDPPPWERLHFHGAYSGALRDLIIDYKFHGGLHRTRLLTSLAAEALRHSADTPGREPCDVIVPVPLHPRRLVARGYNQSIELARGLGRSAGLPVVADALRRTRNTAPQLSLDRHERRENIRDAFAASPARVHGRRVLLVDDVYTTGATLTECARTLLAAGAAGVDVLVLARARREPE